MPRARATILWPIVLPLLFGAILATQRNGATVHAVYNPGLHAPVAFLRALGSCSDEQFDDFADSYDSACLDAFVVDPNVGSADYEEMCSSQCIEPLIEVYVDCGLSGYAYDLRALCGRAILDGPTCIELYETRLQELDEALGSCEADFRQDSGQCAQTCNQSLYILSETYGCCLANLFGHNDSSLIDDYQRYRLLVEPSLYSACGLIDGAPKPCLYQLSTDDDDNTTDDNTLVVAVAVSTASTLVLFAAAVVGTSVLVVLAVRQRRCCFAKRAELIQSEDPGDCDML